MTIKIFLSIFQESGSQRGPADSYLGTVSDTLLTREVGLRKPGGGALGGKQYTGAELGGLNETQVCLYTLFSFRKGAKHTN